MRYAGDRATAEDLLHDAFLKIYGAFDRFTYRGTGSLRAWIERITVNVALEWIRSRSKLGSVTLDEGKAAAEVAEPDVSEMARVPREVLMRFIGELPEGYRAVFNLYCIEEYSHATSPGCWESTKKAPLRSCFAPGHAGPQDQGLFGDALKSRGCSSGISEKVDHPALPDSHRTMKQDKDWIKAMRNALRDAELPPPAGGWERLQRELGGAAPGPEVSGTKPRGSVWRIYRPRIAAAAAAVLILAVAGEFLLRPDKALENDGTVIASVAEDGATAVAIPQPAEPETVRDALAKAVGLPREQVAGEVSSAGRRSLLAAAAGQPAQTAALKNLRTDGEPAVRAGEVVAAEVSGEAAKASSSEVAKASSGEVAKAASGDTAETSGERASKQASGRPATRSAAGAAGRAGFSDEPFVAYTKPHKKASFSLFAGGGVAGGNSEGLAPRMLNTSIKNDASSVIGNGNSLAPLRSSGYGESSFRHHQPLSFGIAVRKEFAHGLSLESGVNYTLLRSDVRMQYTSDDVAQKLHFIGVPLRFNWQFLERGRFSLYMGAGGMVEKCVSARLGSETVDEPGVQWSALAAVGAQYRVGGMVGLYFEPEGSYYFTETGLRTSRTDSPLTLTLRLGVRLSF